MLRLIEGNVLLKPSHRKQLMSWLRRILRMGERLGDFVLTITLHRTGKSYEMKASVHDAAGDFDCRCRQSDRPERRMRSPDATRAVPESTADTA